MRLIAVASLLAGCTDTGAHVTLSAPSGPTTAASFEVVLAAPDPVTQIHQQRVKPSELTTQTVTYFQQRTLAGDSTKIDDVDGFTLRIAPNDSIADTQFIPFMILHDRGDAITGIATYREDAPMPSPILVLRNEIDKYKLTVESVSEPTDELAALGPGQARRIMCAHDDGTPFTSGIVWHPVDGGEYRLLFPDDDGLDATGRELDLDCDGHAVTAENARPDCDDTRERFNRDAPDECDGYDTNCDNAQTIEMTCPLSNLACDSALAPAVSTGVQVCNDAGQAVAPTDCHASATCGCENNAACRYCKMSYELTPTQGTVHPCQPASGALQYLPGCTATAPCDVEIVGARGGWKVEISPSNAGAWTNRVYDAPGTIEIRAKRPEGDTYTQPGGFGTAVEDVDLAIITSTTTSLLTLQLRLDGDAVAQCSTNPPPALICF